MQIRWRSLVLVRAKIIRSEIGFQLALHFFIWGVIIIPTPLRLGWMDFYHSRSVSDHSKFEIYQNSTIESVEVNPVNI